MLLAAVALGVAVVPEGLAATTVVTMMAGINRLVKKNVLVKKIDAVQVLGATNYVVSDKTGTLTAGELRLKEAGARWSRDGAVHTAKARSAWLGEQWYPIVSRRSLPLAV